MSHARKQKSKLMKKELYKFDGFSKAFNKKNELVGHIGVLTWTEGQKPKEVKGIKHYHIWITDFEEPLEANAINLEALKTAMGYYSKYEREWGDYRGFIEAIDKKEATILEVKTSSKEVEY